MVRTTSVATYPEIDSRGRGVEGLKNGPTNANPASEEVLDNDFPVLWNSWNFIKYRSLYQ